MRPSPETIVLSGMAYLLFKHAIADYGLQAPYQLRNKGIYGHPGGLLHCTLHAILTIPVFFIVPGATLGLALFLLAAEFVIHYHIDWAKERLVKARGWSAESVGFGAPSALISFFTVSRMSRSWLCWSVASRASLDDAPGRDASAFWIDRNRPTEDISCGAVANGDPNIAALSELSTALHRHGRSKLFVSTTYQGLRCLKAMISSSLRRNEHSRTRACTETFRNSLSPLHTFCTRRALTR